MLVAEAQAERAPDPDAAPVALGLQIAEGVVLPSGDPLGEVVGEAESEGLSEGTAL